MNFTGEKTEDGVTRREFDLNVNGERVPAVIWAPEGAKGPRPLILMGHGGSQHKKIGNIAAAARHYAKALGYATLAIDAPGHGDRVSREQGAQFSAEIAKRIREGGGVGGEAGKDMAARALQAVPEWNAALDAAQTLDFVGKSGPVGYWGVSMGSALGIPFVAQDKRITCAIFGLMGELPGNPGLMEAAGQIKIPLQFVIQWEDELVSRESALALFNAFGAAQKTMHINPGGHVAIPEYERDGWELFWTRHLGPEAARAR